MILLLLRHLVQDRRQAVPRLHEQRAGRVLATGARVAQACEQVESSLYQRLEQGRPGSRRISRRREMLDQVGGKVVDRAESLFQQRELGFAQLGLRDRVCRAAGGRVVAVGTTSVRCLEAAAQNGDLRPYRGDTRLFIRPGYRFRVVDAMITNFHLPESTLLMLVSAFAGRETVLAAYAEAVREQYRFYSYGDAMLVL